MSLNLLLKFVVPIRNSLYIRHTQIIHRNAGGAKCLVFDLMALITIIMNFWIRKSVRVKIRPQTLA
jgi:hypothetical protein